jgi:K+-transporting ATPase KdpF subunit
LWSARGTSALAKDCERQVIDYLWTGAVSLLLLIYLLYALLKPEKF